MNGSVCRKLMGRVSTRIDWLLNVLPYWRDIFRWLATRSAFHLIKDFRLDCCVGFHLSSLLTAQRAIQSRGGRVLKMLCASSSVKQRSSSSCSSSCSVSAKVKVQTNTCYCRDQAIALLCVQNYASLSGWPSFFSPSSSFSGALHARGWWGSGSHG